MWKREGLFCGGRELFPRRFGGRHDRSAPCTMKGAWAKGKPRLGSGKERQSSAPSDQGHAQPRRDRQSRRAPRTNGSSAPVVSPPTAPPPAIDPSQAPRQTPTAASNTSLPASGSKTNPFLSIAIAEAQTALSDGNIPVGATLTYVGDDNVERVVARGRNRRLTGGGNTRGAVLDCFENAGRQKPVVFKRCSLYLSYCPDALGCGAILHYGVPRVMLADVTDYLAAVPQPASQPFAQPSQRVGMLQSAGVKVAVCPEHAAMATMRRYAAQNQSVWAEDQGVIIAPASQQQQGRADSADRNKQLQQLQQQLQRPSTRVTGPGSQYAAGTAPTSAGRSNSDEWGVDSTLYTTKLDDSQFTPEQIARAEQIAREITQSKSKRR